MDSKQKATKKKETNLKREHLFSLQPVALVPQNT